MFPELIKGLSVAYQALGDRAGDRKQHHKGIPSITFLHDINICHTPLTVRYYAPWSETSFYHRVATQAKRE